MGTFKSHLIALVENERDIWDPTSEGFKLKSVRSRCWIRIHEKLLRMGYTRSVDELKGTWKNLRDAYKRSRNKPNGPSTQRPWVLAPNLKFLDEGNADEVPCSNLDMDNDKDYAEDSGDGDLFECSNACDHLPANPQSCPLASREVLETCDEDGGSQPQAFQSRRIVGGKRSYDDAFAGSSYAHEVADSTGMRVRRDEAESDNKFTAFGYFIGTVLKDLPEQQALQKMQSIWSILFVPAESSMQQSESSMQSRTCRQSMLEVQIKEEG